MWRQLPPKSFNFTREQKKTLKKHTFEIANPGNYLKFTGRTVKPLLIIDIGRK